MNLPLLLFGVGFFGLMAVLGFVQACRKKEKLYYLGAGLMSSLMAVTWILLVLDQFLLVVILIAIVGVASIAAFPKTLKLRERELAKLAQEVNLSAPLRARDFFTDRMWLKLASKWGLRKTMSLFYLISVAIIGGLLFVFSTFYGFITIEYVVVYATTSSILLTLMFYRQLMFYQQFKKTLKRNRPLNSNSHHQTQPSNGQIWP